MSTIIAISGSLRKGSYNTALARACIAHAPEGVTVELADISQFPFYNQDDEASYPPVAAALKEKIRAAQGVLFVTPEYNRSIPGVLKNAFDWLSRPYGDNAFSGKPVYVIGATNGNVGTSLAQADLKKALLFSNAIVLGQPEFYLTQVADKVNDAGEIVDEDTLQHIDKALAAFAAFIQRVG